MVVVALNFFLGDTPLVCASNRATWLVRILLFCVFFLQAGRHASGRLVLRIVEFVYAITVRNCDDSIDAREMERKRRVLRGYGSG